MREIQISVRPEVYSRPNLLEHSVAKAAGLKPGSFCFFILRSSIDARGRQPLYQLKVLITEVNQLYEQSVSKPLEKQVADKREVAVIGAGPAGYFAALSLIEQGFKPIVVERGKDVRSRRRDLAHLNREGVVNSESNYCFGEGGAGTYSDGKLYTRSDKRGNIRQVLEWLVHFGAKPEILIEAHPHIGTNKLPILIHQIREYIESCGGEVRFETKLQDIRWQGGTVTHLLLNQIWHSFDAVILATGHSARDVFRLFHRHKLSLEAKPFALGVRVEHPQFLIDSQQYHCEIRGDYLPPASYSYAFQALDRGFYSFCMCPGGIIAPCATAEGEIVTNGWSPSKRNNFWANSGMVVELRLTDVPGNHVLKMLDFQAEVEQRAFQAGGGAQKAPAQRLVDFVEGHASSTLPDSSYQPGCTSTQLTEVLPQIVSATLLQGLKLLRRKMPAYYTNEALLVAPESRTSSPIRIPRTSSFAHPDLENLFPCGEGAGYAGGIVSAAMDGIRVAQATSHYLNNTHGKNNHT